MKRFVLVMPAEVCTVTLAQKPAVYPARGQSPQKQQEGDGARYLRAKGNTGIGPAVVAQTPPPPQEPTGARVGGTARGLQRVRSSVTSTNDPGHGAAAGATAGAIVGGARARQQHAAQAQAAQANTQATMNTYWRAMAPACRGEVTQFSSVSTAI